MRLYKINITGSEYEPIDYNELNGYQKDNIVIRGQVLTNISEDVTYAFIIDIDFNFHNKYEIALLNQANYIKYNLREERITQLGI